MMNRIIPCVKRVNPLNKFEETDTDDPTRNSWQHSEEWWEVPVPDLWAFPCSLNPLPAPLISLQLPLLSVSPTLSAAVLPIKFASPSLSIRSIRFSLSLSLLYHFQVQYPENSLYGISDDSNFDLMLFNFSIVSIFQFCLVLNCSTVNC